MRAMRPLAWLLSGWIAAGCAVSSDGPPAIRYGTSACAECRMLISEARYAAAASTQAGEPIVFDSTECLVRHVRRAGSSLARMWVHDYGADRWLAAADAFYVASPELATPMGQGVVATASAAEADRLAGTARGRVLRFAQLADWMDRAAQDDTRSP